MKRKQEDMEEDLCKHCEVGDIQSSIHFMCEGRWCESAYDSYLESDDDEEEDTNEQEGQTEERHNGANEERKPKTGGIREAVQNSDGIPRGKEGL